MQIESRITGRLGVAVVKTDRIDAAAAPELRLAVLPVLLGMEQVILDLSSVTFMDETGLGAILSLLNVRQGPRTLAISGAAGQVETLFRLTHMNKIFPMYRNQGDAEQALAAA